MNSYRIGQVDHVVLPKVYDRLTYWVVQEMVIATDLMILGDPIILNDILAEGVPIHFCEFAITFYWHVFTLRY